MVGHAHPDAHETYMIPAEDSSTSSAPSGRTRVVHCKRERYDVYIERGRGSRWGNPFVIGRDGDRPR
jgi:hypothetical protein